MPSASTPSSRPQRRSAAHLAIAIGLAATLFGLTALAASPAGAEPQRALAGVGEHLAVSGTIDGAEIELWALDGHTVTESGVHTQYGCISVFRDQSSRESGCGPVTVTYDGDDFRISGTLPTRIRRDGVTTTGSVTVEASSTLLTSHSVPTGELTLNLDPVDAGAIVAAPNRAGVPNGWSYPVRDGNDFGWGRLTLTAATASGSVTDGLAYRRAGIAWSLQPSDSAGVPAVEDAGREHPITIDPPAPGEAASV